MPILDFLGKSDVVQHHKHVPVRLLHEEPSLSFAAENAEQPHILVEGDNLVALRALLPRYGGQVKCIYIDPPYNTGNEGWAYNDNVKAPQIQAWLNSTVGRDDLSRHDKWLCMMYPRLTLLREFLRTDGVIFISIDDNEVHHLRCIMDEIFGAENFITNIVWQKKQSPQNDAINLSDMHDHILVYAKRAKSDKDDTNGWTRNLLPRLEEQNNRYQNPDNDSRGAWTSGDATCNKTVDERPNLYFAVKNPHTEEMILPSKQNVWRYEKSTFDKLLAENRIWWGKSKNSFPRVKRFRSEVADGVVPSTWWTRDEAGDNQESKREIRNILTSEEQNFATPKPTRLISRILQIATDPDSIILDSFAGSGTTAHAVMQLNNEDGGQRRAILVEMEPTIAESITAERLRRVAGGYTDAKGKQVEGLGGGFRYMRLGAELFDEHGNIASDVRFAELARYVFFYETGVPLPEIPTTDTAQTQAKTPLLGVANGKIVYLLYNGILKDKTPQGGNALTRETLALLEMPSLGESEEPLERVVYGTSCRLPPQTLATEGIVFKQIPYSLHV